MHFLFQFPLFGVCIRWLCQHPQVAPKRRKRLNQVPADLLDISPSHLAITG